MNNVPSPRSGTEIELRKVPFTQEISDHDPIQSERITRRDFDLRYDGPVGKSEISTKSKSFSVSSISDLITVGGDQRFLRCTGKVVTGSSRTVSSVGMALLTQGHFPGERVSSFQLKIFLI